MVIVCIASFSVVLGLLLSYWFCSLIDTGWLGEKNFVLIYRLRHDRELNSVSFVEFILLLAIGFVVFCKGLFLGTPGGNVD